MQWRGLNVGRRADGASRASAARLKFWLRTGVRARRCSVADVERLHAQGATVVDHGLTFPSAELVFVHNLATEAERHVPGHATAEAAQREREFFRALQPVRDRRRQFEARRRSAARALRLGARARGRSLSGVRVAALLAAACRAVARRSATRARRRRRRAARRFRDFGRFREARPRSLPRVRGAHRRRAARRAVSRRRLEGACRTTARAHPLVRAGVVQLSPEAP